MIRVAVMYPNEEGKRFDFSYYRESHLPLVKDKLKPNKIEFDIGVRTGGSNTAPYLAIGYMIFNNIEEFNEGFSSFGSELASDIANYTDIQPLFQISEVVEV